MESLSGESKLLYDILTSETDEIYEAKFASYCARACATAATARSTPRSTAPLRAPSGSAAEASDSSATSSASTTPTTAAASSLVLSFERDTTDNFAPEARRLCDLLVGGSATPTPTLASRVRSSAIPTGGILESAATTAVPEKDIRAVTPTNCSTICPGGDTSTASTPSSPVASSTFSPASATTVSTVLPAPTEIKDVHEAVHINNTDLVVSAPTTCSAECPSHDASVYAAALIPSATPKSSAATGDVVPELAVPEVTDKATDMDLHCCFEPELTAAFSTPTPALDLSHAHSTSANCFTSVAVSTTISATTLLSAAKSTPASSVPTPASTTTVSAALVSPAMGGLLEGGNNLTLQPPWPPEGYVIMCKNMIQALQLDGFILEGVQPMLWAAKTLWPLPNRSTRIQIILQWDDHTCRITRLHCTMDTKQISGDMPFLGTMAFEWDALTGIIFSLAVQCIQLQPVLFEWPDCFDILFPNPSTLDFLLVRRAAHIVWNWCCPVHLHGNTNGALEEEHGQVLLPMPWPSFRCGWVASYPILFWKPATVHPHEDSDSYVGSFALRWTSFCDNNQMHMLTELGSFWSKLLSIGETEDCLQYEQLQHWPPSDHCWSDIHWAQSTIAVFDKLLQHKHETTELMSVQLQCESRNRGCNTSMEEIVPAQFLEVYNMLCRLTSNQFPADLIVIEHWLIPWEPGDDSPGHHLMKLFALLAITCERHNCSIVADTSIDASAWVWFMRCVHLGTDRPPKCVLHLRPKPPWSDFSPTILSSEFRSNLMIVSECTHITIIYLELNQFGVAAIHGSKSYGWFGFERKLIGQHIYWLLGLYSSCDQFIMECVTHFRLQLFNWHIPLDSCSASGHWRINFALLFNWDVTSTIDSVPAVSSNSGMFSHPLQLLELGNYFAMAILLLGSHQSEAWVLYLPTTSIIQCGYKLMWCEAASAKEGILTYTERVHNSWDPGGPDIVLDTVTCTNSKDIHLSLSHLTWDPGGYICKIGLRASRVLRRGDCQRPPSTHYWAGWVGHRFGPWPAWKPDAEETGAHIYEQSGHSETWLGTERKGGFGRGGEACSLCCYAVLFSSASST